MNTDRADIAWSVFMDSGLAPSARPGMTSKAYQPKRKILSRSTSAVLLEPPCSLHLDVARADEFAPLVGFLGDHLGEIRGRHRRRLDAQLGKPRLQLGIGEAGVDLVVQSHDDLGRRVARRADAVAAGSLITHHRLADRR